MGIAHQTDKFRALQANPAAMAEAKQRLGIPVTHEPPADPAKETGTLMRPELAQLTHAGVKTNTRRLLKLPKGCSWYAGLGGEAEGWWEDEAHPAGWWHLDELASPYGSVGDRLWIREEHYLWGTWKINGETKAGADRWRFDAARSEGVLFEPPQVVQTDRATGLGWWKRNSLFMPRWACRTVVELTEVRVERLQDISESDALAEGCTTTQFQLTESGPGIAGGGAITARENYRALWEAINGSESWSANPWVWSLHFKRVATPAS